MLILGIIAVVLGIIGVVGSLLPALPGPPISLLGVAALYFFASPDRAISGEWLIMWLLITIVVTVVDYMVPIRFAQLTGGGKMAGRGATIGMILGIIFTPIGMLTGAFLGAFFAELICENRGATAALKAACGTFIGFIFGTGMKLFVSLAMLFHIVAILIR